MIDREKRNTYHRARHKKMNMKDAYHLFFSGINNKDTFYAGYYHLLIASMVKYIKKRSCKESY